MPGLLRGPANAPNNRAPTRLMRVSDCWLAHHRRRTRTNIRYAGGQPQTPSGCQSGAAGRRDFGCVCVKYPGQGRGARRHGAGPRSARGRRLQGGRIGSGRPGLVGPVPDRRPGRARSRGPRMATPGDAELFGDGDYCSVVVLWLEIRAVGAKRARTPPWSACRAWRCSSADRSTARTSLSRAGSSGCPSPMA